MKNSIRSRSIASITAGGLNPVWMYTVPAVSSACRHWPKPPRWNSGRICRCAEPATWSPISIAIPATLTSSAPCRSGMALACPVVPLVCTSASTVCADNSGRGGTGPARAAPSAQPGGTSPITTRRVRAGAADSTRAVNSASATIATGSTSASTSASSPADSRQFTNAGVAPARMIANACTRKSALFLATIATTSPGAARSAQPPARRSSAARSSA